MSRFTPSCDPIKHFKDWMNEAKKQAINYPEAFCLSTYHESKKALSSRMLLLKEITQDSFIFFTNYKSFKAESIQSHKFVSANFYWDLLRRQIRIQGGLQKIPYEKSLSYWETRDKESQISSLLSLQSQKIPEGLDLSNEFEKLKKDFKNKKVPLDKDTWGGYELIIDKIEFWMEQSHRLHERFVYEKKEKAWSFYRLYP